MAANTTEGTQKSGRAMKYLKVCTYSVHIDFICTPRLLPNTLFP